MAEILKQIFVVIFLVQILVGQGQLNINVILNQNFDCQTKLGQILMFNFWPNYEDDFIRSLIRDYKIGNFNLVGEYQNEQQVERITDLIKEEAKKYLPLPPLIAVDEEGYIKRLPFLNSIPQSNLKDVDSAYREAFKRGQELKKLGFNMVFSPVLDFTEDKEDYIWKRTFQQNKEKTISLGKAMVNGYKDAGIISVPKHFPGYINEVNDPHGDNFIKKTLNDYSDSLEVFKEVIKQSNPYGLMFAHLAIREFGDNPITRSKDFVNFIQKDLDYKGLLVTDSLGMKSFRLDDSFEVATLESLLAGYDLLILSSNKSVSLQVVEFLNGQLNRLDVQSAIDKSFIKIYFAKILLGK